VLLGNFYWTKLKTILWSLKLTMRSMLISLHTQWMELVKVLSIGLNRVD